MLLHEKTTSKLFCLTQEQVDFFGQACYGVGRIHLDEDYAKKTPFGGTLVHGFFIFALVEQELEVVIPDWRQTGFIEITFIRPILTGSKFKIYFEKSMNTEVEIAVLDEKKILASGKFIYRD